MKTHKELLARNEVLKKYLNRPRKSDKRAVAQQHKNVESMTKAAADGEHHVVVMNGSASGYDGDIVELVDKLTGRKQNITE
jgi:polyphosphate kinase 2 (PPK2 family)